MREPEDQPLGYLLYQAMATLRPRVTAELGPLGIGLPEFVCMRNLAMFPDQSNAELARHANVSPQAMNLVLRALEEQGAITRPASASAGRSLPARLTRKGTALLKRAEKAVQVADDGMLEALSSKQRAELKRALYLVGARALEDERP